MNNPIRKLTAAMIAATLFAAPAASAEEKNSPIAVEAAVYSVSPGNIEAMKKAQARMHEKLAHMPGFIGSVRGQGVAEEKLDAVFIDYVFWAVPDDARAAGDRLENDAPFRKLHGLMLEKKAFHIGEAVDSSRHHATQWKDSILEVAVSVLKDDFEKDYKNARLPIVTWIDHLRGSEGMVTAKSADDPRQMLDVVLWNNLPDAIYASETFDKYDFGRVFAGCYEKMTFYGHFRILGVEGRP